MPRTEPRADILAVVQAAELEIREQLIEKAATIGLTPDEARRAATLEHNWRADLEDWATRNEAADAQGD